MATSALKCCQLWKQLQVVPGCSGSEVGGGRDVAPVIMTFLKLLVILNICNQHDK